MMGHREKLNGGELTVFSGWRRVVCWCGRAGKAKWWKREFQRRIRHRENRQIRTAIQEGTCATEE